jgi:predicted RecA/RadA family phage recombinase
MATNYGHPGKVLTFTAPTGGVVSGTPCLIGGYFAIATATVAQTLPFEGALDGVWTLNKTTGEGALVVGQAAFWDAANAKVTVDPGLGLAIGAIETAAATGDTTCSVRLNGTSLAGRVHNVRKRIAVASVNAGATLLPAVAGCKWRLVNAEAISIGGAAGAVTTVDILATLSSSRKLVAFAQASLTQSTELKSGGTGAAILADGASYTANDVSTAITVGITGSAITTATHIDFKGQFALE